MSSSPARRRPSAPSPVQHGRLRRSSVWRTLAAIIGGTAAVALVGGAGVTAYAAWDLGTTMKPTIDLVGDKDDNLDDISAIEGGVNLLMIGSDSREGQDPGFGGPGETGVNADVMMLLHIAQDHSSATVVSFPRDLLVSIPSCPKEDGSGNYEPVSQAKMNSSLARGGLPCTVLTAEKLTGLDIQFAAVAQFSGVMAMSSAIGGVEVCVATPIRDRYTGIDLDAGMHSLEGMEALQFLRTRHGVGDGSDLGRISNQQVFMSAMARQLTDAGTLSDPTKLYGLAKAALANMQFSNSLADVNKLVSIGLAMKNVPPEKLSLLQFPAAIERRGGSDVLLPVSGDAELLMGALRADQPFTIAGDTGLGSVVDGGTEVPGETPPVPGATPEPGATAPVDPATPGTGTPTPGGAIELPSNILGQTADLSTCSAGNARR